MKIGRALAGGHVPSIATATFAHKDVREELLLKVIDLVKEVDALCRKENPPQHFDTIQLWIWKALI